MEILYLLIPLSLVAVLGIGVAIWWAVGAGQFDSLESEGRRILAPDPEPVAEPEEPQEGQEGQEGVSVGRNGEAPRP